MTDTKRADRRHNRARMVRKAKKVYPTDPCPARLADNLKSCSCWMCCNWRKTEGPPASELRRPELYEDEE